MTDTPQWVVEDMSPLTGSLLSLRTIKYADRRRDPAVLSKVGCGMISARKRQFGQHLS